MLVHELTLDLLAAPEAGSAQTSRRFREVVARAIVKADQARQRRDQAGDRMKAGGRDCLPTRNSVVASAKFPRRPPSTPSDVRPIHAPRIACHHCHEIEGINRLYHHGVKAQAAQISVGFLAARDGNKGTLASWTATRIEDADTRHRIDAEDNDGEDVGGQNRRGVLERRGFNDVRSGASHCRGRQGAALLVVVDDEHARTVEWPRSANHRGRIIPQNARLDIFGAGVPPLEHLPRVAADLAPGIPR